ETHRGGGLGDVRGAAAVGGELGVFQLRQVLVEVGVRRQAVRAAVDLGGGRGGSDAGGDGDTGHVWRFLGLVGRGRRPSKGEPKFFHSSVLECKYWNQSSEIWNKDGSSGG